MNSSIPSLGTARQKSESRQQSQEGITSHCYYIFLHCHILTNYNPRDYNSCTGPASFGTPPHPPHPTVPGRCDVPFPFCFGGSRKRFSGLPETCAELPVPNSVNYIQSSRPNAPFLSHKPQALVFKAVRPKGREKSSEAQVQGGPSLLPAMLCHWALFLLHLEARRGYRSRATPLPIHS